MYIKHYESEICEGYKLRNHSNPELKRRNRLRVKYNMGKLRICLANYKRCSG